MKTAVLSSAISSGAVQAHLAAESVKVRRVHLARLERGKRREMREIIEIELAQAFQVVERAFARRLVAGEKTLRFRKSVVGKDAKINAAFRGEHFHLTGLQRVIGKQRAEEAVRICGVRRVRGIGPQFRAQQRDQLAAARQFVGRGLGLRLDELRGRCQPARGARRVGEDGRMASRDPRAVGGPRRNVGVGKRGDDLTLGTNRVRVKRRQPVSLRESESGLPISRRPRSLFDERRRGGRAPFATGFRGGGAAMPARVRGGPSWCRNRR